MKQLATLLLIVLALSCKNAVIKTNDLKVNFLEEGEIKVTQTTNSRQLAHFTLKNGIEGCRIDGIADFKKIEGGGIEITKRLVNDSLNAACSVIEKYTPTEHGIQCKMIIKGEGGPWSSPIITSLEYLDSVNDTKVWSTWAAPQYNKSLADSTLLKSLVRIGATLKDKTVLNADGKEIRVEGKRNPRYWIDPLVPVPFSNATYYFGAPAYSYDNPRIAFGPFQEDLISIPLASILNADNNSGISLVLSPSDFIVDLTMHTTADGAVSFKRFFNRISKDQEVEFNFDIVSHESDWRCGLGWMKDQYPNFFNPKNPLAHEMDGTGAYSSYSVESLDFDVEKMKKMAFTVNWQASFDFPYMGLFLPPLQKNEHWTRYSKGKVSISEMDDYAKKYRDNGFYVLNYFNVTEFGTKIKYPPEKSMLNAKKEDMWRDANQYLYSEFKEAILPRPEKSIKDSTFKNAEIPYPYHTWGQAVAMDCGESTYMDFLLAQAQQHVDQIPNSYGIAIDRLDWVRLFNERADDGVTWFDNKPVRSLIYSWKNISSKLSTIMHGAGKVIFVNNHCKRIDILENVDGIFDEFTYAGSSLNLTAFVCVGKPALGWTDKAETIRDEGGDTFFQKYLYMGVYPMCPFPNNDHSISPSEDVDQMYIDYGPLMKQMKGSEWVLKPHVISVKDGAAKVNIFKTKEGYAIPVVYGEKAQVEVELDTFGEFENFTCKAYYPGIEQPMDIDYRKKGNKIVMQVPLKRGCSMLALIPASNPK